MNEIAPVHMRGALVDVHAVMLVLGYTIQGWVGFGFYFWQSGGTMNTWRPPIAIQCFWPLCLLIGLLFVPVSGAPGKTLHLHHLTKCHTLTLVELKCVVDFRCVTGVTPLAGHARA